MTEGWRTVQPLGCSRCFLSAAQRVSVVRRSALRPERGRGGGTRGSRCIVSPEDTNGFWCRVIFTQHLTHGAVPLQSLHFRVHYHEERRRHRRTGGCSDCPKWGSVVPDVPPFKSPFTLCISPLKDVTVTHWPTVAAVCVLLAGLTYIIDLFIILKSFVLCKTNSGVNKIKVYKCNKNVQGWETHVSNMFGLVVEVAGRCDWSSTIPRSRNSGEN